MKILNRLSYLAIFFHLFVSLSATAQASDISDDKALSPYFLLTTPEADTDQFVLNNTRADVNILGFCWVLLHKCTVSAYQGDERTEAEVSGHELAYL